MKKLLNSIKRSAKSSPYTQQSQQTEPVKSLSQMNIAGTHIGSQMGFNYPTTIFTLK